MPLIDKIVSGGQTGADRPNIQAQNAQRPQNPQNFSFRVWPAVCFLQVGGLLVIAANWVHNNGCGFVVCAAPVMSLSLSGDFIYAGAGRGHGAGVERGTAGECQLRGQEQ